MFKCQWCGSFVREYPPDRCPHCTGPLTPDRLSQWEALMALASLGPVVFTQPQLARIQGMYRAAARSLTKE